MSKLLEISIDGVYIGYGKSAWSWVVSSKIYRVGTAKVKNPVAAQLVALQQVIDDVPDSRKLTIKTGSREIATIISNAYKPHEESKNPLIRALQKRISGRMEPVNVVLVTGSNSSQNDKIASLLVKKSKDKVSSQRKTPVRRKASSSRPTGIITTELDSDVVATPRSTPRSSKPVMCSSCDLPVHPLTMECGCSN